MLKLKLQYFGHLMRRIDSLEKTLILVHFSLYINNIYLLDNIGEGDDTSLQYSCLENPMDRGAHHEESDTTERLHFHFSLSCSGEEMAAHSSVLDWRIPGTGEPGGLPCMGSHRVGHD